jgi:RNA polymerase sigma factor (sigma-70 family)
MSGPDLIRRAQSGDPAAIGELFTRYWRAARAAAFSATGNWPASEDAASNAFLQALRKLHTLDDPARFPAWLRTIAIREAQTSAPHQPLSGAAPEPVAPGASPVEQLERAQLASLLRVATAQLPNHLREPIALHYFEGYSPADAASFLDIPDSTFRRRLHDARRRLRTIFESLLTERNPMQPDLASIETLLNSGHAYEALRASLPQSPIHPEVAALFRQRLPSSSVAPLANQILNRLAANPNPALDQIARSLIEALPPTVATRRSFALIRLTPDGTYSTLHDVILESPNLTEAAHELRFATVLDLIWPAQDLQEVQTLLADLCAQQLPRVTPTFSLYREPRYRAALQLTFPQGTGATNRTATGGILHEASGHARLYLEAWLAAPTGDRPHFPLGAEHAIP